MPALVAQVAHRLAVVLDAGRHLRLDALEPLVDEVERNADERRPVGTAPLIAEIHRRPKRDALCVELGVQLLDEAFDARARGS